MQWDALNPASTPLSRLSLPTRTLVRVILSGLNSALLRAPTFENGVSWASRSADFSLVEGLRAPLLASLLKARAGKSNTPQALLAIVATGRDSESLRSALASVMPEARVGHIGIVRDEVTLKPRAYLERLPLRLCDGPVVLVDPMLATGGSAVAALDTLKKAGAEDLRMMVLVASPLGVKRVHEAHADVAIYAAAVDPLLNDKGYIMPGLGDAGDRMYGTV